jgi:hypothetical protein
MLISKSLSEFIRLLVYPRKNLSSRVVIEIAGHARLRKILVATGALEKQVLQEKERQEDERNE